MYKTISKGDSHSVSLDTSRQVQSKDKAGNKRFSPSEEELVHFAIQRATEGPLSSSVLHEGLFKECDLYAIEPMKLFQEAEEGVLYVFTKLKKKNLNGTRIDRKVANKGTWKERDKAKTLYNQKNQIVGWCRGFEYSLNSSKSILTTSDHYRMKEYSLHSSVLSHAKFKDYVLCKIKKYLKKKRRNKNLRDCLASPADDDDTKLKTWSSDSSLSSDHSTPEILLSVEIPAPEVPSSPCPVRPMSCGVLSDPASGAMKNGHLIERKVVSVFNTCGAPVGDRPASDSDTCVNDHQEATLNSTSAAPLIIIPSQSTDHVQTEPSVLNQCFDKSLKDDDDDDCNFDWPMYFAEELKQFQMQNLENNHDGKMLHNTMAFWNLEDMLFQ